MYDPIRQICLFGNHVTTVAGDTLFIDGGDWASNRGFNDNNTAPASSVNPWQSASCLAQLKIISTTSVLAESFSFS